MGWNKQLTMWKLCTFYLQKQTQKAGKSECTERQTDRSSTYRSGPVGGDCPVKHRQEELWTSVLT